VKTWIAIIGVAAATYLLRASFIVFADPHRFAPAFRRALLYVPPSVLAAIVAPGLLMVNGALDISPANLRWIAGVIAIGLSAWTRSAVGAIAGGMAALWLLQWALGGS
jgi:branched-subunit amino acid transport protein